MLNPPSGTTTEAYIAAIRSGSPVHMRFTQAYSTTLTDADFHSDGVIIRTYFNSDTELTVGKSVKTELVFKVFQNDNTAGFSFGNEFDAEVGVEIGGSTVWVTLGKFRCYEDERYVDEDILEYVAYDRMYKFDVPAETWLKGLTYPMTVSQMFSSLCSYVGLTGEIGNALTKMKNRSFATAPIQNLGVMCRDVLELIAEACGCYAVITPTGNCKLKWYSPANYSENGSTVTYTVKGNDIFSRRIKNFTTNVSCVNVKQTEDDVGVTYPDMGYIDNVYVIVDNPFLVTADNTEVENYVKPLKNRFSALTHAPAEVVCIGNPLIEAGDQIYVARTTDLNTSWIPIYVKEMHWDGSLTDTYISTGTRVRPSYTSAIKQKLSQGGRYHIFKNTIDTLYSELYDPTTGDISVLDQRASALELSVADKYSIVSGIGITSAGVEVTGSKYVKIISGGSFLVDATNFKIDSENKLMKCGSWQFDNTGMRYTFANNNEFRIYNGADPYSSGGSYPANMKSGIRVHKPTGWNEFGILVPDYAGVLREFSFFPHGASAGMPGGVSFIAPGDIDNDIYAHTYGWYSVTSEYIYALQAINPSSRERKHDIRPLDDKSELIDKLQPVSFVYNKDKKGKTCFGLIYEDTVDIIPEICFDEKEKGINYTELIPILLKEIQSLRKRVSSLENPTK